MQREPVITWRNVQRSEAVETIIHKRIEAIERLCPDALGLRVTLDAPQKPRHAARGFDVRLHLEVPGRIWTLPAPCATATQRTISSGR